MSVPVPLDPSFWIFVGTSLGAALFGGWHCAGMCGPLAALASNRRAVFLYQAGRLGTYLLLGLAASLAGERLLSLVPPESRWALTLVAGLFSAWILLSTWRLGLAENLQKWLWRHRPRGRVFSEFFFLGVFNGLLPCSWLYGFIFVAAGLAHPPRALALMFCLWAGSLPWLLGFSFLGGRIRAAGASSPWFSRVLFASVLLGLVAHHLHDLAG